MNLTYYEDLTLEMTNNRFFYQALPGESAGFIYKEKTERFLFANNQIEDAVLDFQAGQNGRVDILGNQVRLGRLTDGRAAISTSFNENRTALVDGNRIESSVVQSQPGIASMQNVGVTGLIVRNNLIMGFRTAVRLQRSGQANHRMEITNNPTSKAEVIVTDDQTTGNSSYIRATQVAYEVHQANVGWTSQATDGAVSGDPGGGQLEAVRISTGAQMRLHQVGVCYRPHVAHIGWMNWSCNGQDAGTEGQNKALEALDLYLQNPAPGMQICARAYLQNVGWQEERCGTSVTVGTTGQSRAISALHVWVLM